MVNSFKFFVGGILARTDAVEYTGQLVRGSYKKNFCGEYDFNCTIDGVTKSSDGANIARDKNVFFTIYTGSVYYLLMKGVIKDITWASKYRCTFSGLQCKRGAAGGIGGLENQKAPQLTDYGEMSISDMLGDTAWYAASKVYKDDGTTGENKRLRSN